MSTLLMIDGNSMANRAFYGVPHLTNAKGVPTNAVYGFLNTLQAAIERFKPDTLFVAFDISKKVFRHERYADYKGTRTGMPEDLLVQMPLIKEALGYMNIETFGLEGYEADDIIGTMSAHQTGAGRREHHFERRPRSVPAGGRAGDGLLPKEQGARDGDRDARVSGGTLRSHTGAGDRHEGADGRQERQHSGHQWRR